MIKRLCRLILKVCGWEVIYDLPKQDRYVVIAAPHTTNWDFPLGILYIIAAGVPFRYMGKSALFKWPHKYLFKALGGIGVDRDNKTKLTTRLAKLINEQDKIALALSPEGTRSNSQYWRSGFYYIALEAQVPIAMAVMDYENRQIGIKKTIIPTGDIDADMQLIKHFFQNVKGKYPEKQGPIQIKPKKD